MYYNTLQPCLIDVNNNSTTLQTCNDSTPNGNVLDLAYNYNQGTSNNGNVVSWNATGNQSFVRTFTYDGLNRVRTETQYPSWPTLRPTLVTTSTYDLNGNLATLDRLTAELKGTKP